MQSIIACIFDIVIAFDSALAEIATKPGSENDRLVVAQFKGLPDEAHNLKEHISIYLRLDSG